MNDLILNNEPSNIFLEIRTVIFSLIENNLQVFLFPEQQTDGSFLWNIPGKRIYPIQPLEKTSSDIIHHYTQVQETYQEQLYTYANLNQNVNEQVISIIYFSLIPSYLSTNPSPDCKESKWFAINALPSMLENYKSIILYALCRLRYKIEYSAVGFELLPKDFSLSQLQKTYEIILGEELDKRNFRRRILESGIIEPTPHLKTGEGRPARLYRYKSDAIAEIKARRLFP